MKFDVKEITLGLLHTYAIDYYDKAFCWGSNADGQLGDGSFNDSDVPVEVNLPENKTYNITHC